ncbi:MAG: hypothetical protein ACREXR_10085 [Gammaproteobacteria bacterium]
MPKKRRNWAAWNYRVDRDDNNTLRASFTDHMNTLQRMSDNSDYFVTINDRHTEIGHKPCIPGVLLWVPLLSVL